jgi:hypothetical protein
MSAQTICDRCGDVIKSPNHDLHRVRLVLVNADEYAPKEHTDITGDYHHKCAAFLFHAARGQERPS